MIKTITTDGVTPAQRARFWHEAICDTFVELDCRIERDTPFSGSLNQIQVGPLSCTHVQAGAQRVTRASRRTPDGDEYVLVSIETTGHGVVRQDRREALLEQGSFAIYDTARPYELCFDEHFSQTVVQIPRALLKQRLGMIEHVTAIPLVANDPLGQLTRDYLLGLSRFDGEQDALVVERVAQQAVDLLAMTLQSNAHINAMTSVPRATLLFRIKQTIESHLRDADFGPTALSLSVNLSSRYVNQLFSDEDTSFGRYQLDRRLWHCARDLRDSRMRHRTINDIAFSWGFNSISHFSTTFRKFYGVSPREYRGTASEPNRVTSVTADS
jgi:AraC-like DNA-binding protein